MAKANIVSIDPVAAPHAQAAAQEPVEKSKNLTWWQSRSDSQIASMVAGPILMLVAGLYLGMGDSYGIINAIGSDPSWVMGTGAFVSLGFVSWIFWTFIKRYKIQNANEREAYSLPKNWFKAEWEVIRNRTREQIICGVVLLILLGAGIPCAAHWQGDVVHFLGKHLFTTSLATGLVLHSFAHWIIFYPGDKEKIAERILGPETVAEESAVTIDPVYKDRGEAEITDGIFDD